MQYITTTQLRTKSKELVKTLQEGRSVDLIHRSRLIGAIKPVQAKPKVFNAERFKKIVDKLNLPSTTYAQREKIYRDHLMRKYGKGISGR